MAKYNIKTNNLDEVETIVAQMLRDEALAEKQPLIDEVAYLVSEADPTSCRGKKTISTTVQPELHEAMAVLYKNSPYTRTTLLNIALAEWLSDSNNVARALMGDV